MSIFNYRLKQSENDFDETKLPRTRKQQFLDILKNRFSTILLTGFWLFVFFIPCLIFIVLKDSFTYYVSTSGYYVGDDINKALSVVKLVYSACMVIGLIIFSIGVSAALKIFRRLIWEETLFYKYDFFLGIKDNFLHVFFVALTVGLLSLLCTYLELLTNGTNNLFISVPSGINFVIIFPIFYTFCFITSIFKNKFFKNLKISISLLARSFLFSLIPCLIIYVCLYIRFINIYVVKYIVAIVFMIFISPILLLGFWESEIYVIDKHINENFYPDYYLKGLYNPLKSKNK